MLHLQASPSALNFAEPRLNVSAAFGVISTLPCVDRFWPAYVKVNSVGPDFHACLLSVTCDAL